MKSINAIAGLSFIFGVCIGIGVSWKYLENKYSDLAQEEIDSVKEVYSKKYKHCDSGSNADKDNIDNLPENMDMRTYEEKTKKYKPTDYNAISTPIKDAEIRKENNKPFIISPEKFGEIEGYEQVTLTHYADGVLADIHDNKIDNIDELVGSDYEKHFGEYEDDSVHIRNESQKTDYEILYDERYYSDIVPDTSCSEGEDG